MCLDSTSVERSLQGLVKQANVLMSLPDVFLRINALMNEDCASLQRIAGVVALDAALSTRLLKVVNSPYYGHSGRIDTISRAMNVVGLQDFYHILLGTCAADMFKRIPHDLVSMADFWRHSLYCAVIARLLAKQAATLHSERLFVAGLLHQVGALILFERWPDEMRALLLELHGQFWQLGEVEQARWGFSYADVGGALAQHWGLPDNLRAMMAYHLAPAQAEPALQHDVWLLHTAYRLKNRLLTCPEFADAPTEIELTQLAQPINLSAAQLREVLATAPEQARAAAQLLGRNSERIHPAPHR